MGAIIGEFSQDNADPIGNISSLLSYTPGSGLARFVVFITRQLRNSENSRKKYGNDKNKYKKKRQISFLA
ncbi:MAG: ERG4/ERG24 family protein [Thermoproteota archaeon]|nr:ERG4/ERG24 family protein [Thermoproteota archaeon]